MILIRLKIVSSYSGVTAKHFINDGRIFGLRDKLPVILNIDDEKIEQIDVELQEELNNEKLYDLSLDGQILAISIDEYGFYTLNLITKEIRKYNFQLTSQEKFSFYSLSINNDCSLIISNVNRFRKSR